jgi:hypothetical protein
VLDLRPKPFEQRRGIGDGLNLDDRERFPCRLAPGVSEHVRENVRHGLYPEGRCIAVALPWHSEPVAARGKWARQFVSAGDRAGKPTRPAYRG